MRIIHGLVLSAVAGGLVACSLRGIDRGGAKLFIQVDSRNDSRGNPDFEEASLISIAPFATPTSPAPSTVGAFDCLGVNVSGPGIPDSSRNPSPNSMALFNDLVAGKSYCSYRGILAGPLSATAAAPQDVTLVVPPGSPRLIQIVGLVERNGSHDCVREFTNAPEPSPNPTGKVEADVYELGRQIVNLSQDTSVTVSMNWNALSPAVKLSRSLKCGDGPVAPPTPTLGTFAAMTSMATARYDPGTYLDLRGGGTKIHVIGGSNSSFGETYDFALASWSNHSGMGTLNLYRPVLLPYSTADLIRFGGATSGIATYQTSTGTSWAPSSSIVPSASIGYSSPVFVPGQQITYFFGGHPGSTQILKYNHMTAAVSANPNPLSIARSHTATTLLPTGKILIVGGTDGTSIFGTCDMLDPGTGAVTACGSLPIAIYDGLLFPLGNAGNALLVGGTAGTYPGNATNAVYLYSFAGNTWSPAGTIPLPRTEAAGTVLPDGRIFVLGGRDGAGNALNSTLFYDGAGWTAGPNMVTPRMAFSIETMPDHSIVVIGGKNTGGSAIPNVEKWVP